MRWIHERPASAALLFFCAWTVVHTWPLAAAPGRHARVDNGDMLLNAWATSWVAHQLPRNPLALFDGNIFYPERRTLAYSEPLIVQGVIAIPVETLGGSAVLAHNLALLAGMALTGWAFCVVVARWTGSWGAGLVSGALAAFNAHTLTRLAHLQAQHLEFLPLAMLALDQLFRRRRARDAVCLAGAVAIQGSASIYFLVFTGFSVALGALVRGEWWHRGERWRLTRACLVSVVVLVAVIAPLLWPYLQLNRELGLARSADETRLYVSTWEDYLKTGGTLHFWWSKRFIEAKAANFPGVLASGLVLVTVLTGVAWRDPRARMWLAVGVGAVVLSMAPNAPGFDQVFAIAVPLQAIRAFARFGQLALAAVAVLGGFGVAEILRRVPGRRAQWAVAGAVVLIVSAEALRAPLWYDRYSGLSRVYEHLGRERSAVLLELPIFEGRGIARNAPYLLNATAHWHPVVNGYSGFIPPRYGQRASALADFPADGALSAASALGITHVAVHLSDVRTVAGPERVVAIERHPTLRLVAEDRDVRLYELRH